MSAIVAPCILVRVGDIRIGTSGWRYPPWRGTFYPDGLVQRRELEYLSRSVSSIEINGSFYSLQRPDSFRSWFAETPDDFLFAVKGPRFVTHLKQLRDVETPVANFLASGVLALGAKLGPVLWQLPPRMRFNPSRVEDFLALLPRTTSAAAELADPARRARRGPGVDGHRRRPAAAARDRAAARVVPGPGVRGAAARARRRARAQRLGGDLAGVRRADDRSRLRPSARAGRAVRGWLHRRRAGPLGGADPRAGAGRGATSSSTSTTT